MDVSNTTTDIKLTREDLIEAIKLLIHDKAGIPRDQIDKIGLNPDELPEEIDLLIKHTFTNSSPVDVLPSYPPGVRGHVRRTPDDHNHEVCEDQEPRRWIETNEAN